MGSGPLILGHSHPSVVAEVSRAVKNGSTFFATNEAAVTLAEELVKAIPSAEKVRFTTSGTDACFQGLRIARSFRKKDKILKFEGAFHGTSDYAWMSVLPKSLRDYPLSEAGSGIPKILEELVLIAPFNNSEMTTSIIEKHHDELAAVIVEPIQRFIPPRKGFLQNLREITAHYGVPLIFDEVVTGFRVAYGGAQEYYNVIPDLTAVGKIMGGGYPLGAICGREDIMSAYDHHLSGNDYVNQIGTLNGNPIACIAGLSTLAELRKDGSYERIRAVGSKLRFALQKLCDARDIKAQTLGDDTVFDIIFTGDPISDYRSTIKADANRNNKFRNILQEYGVLRGPQKFYPSLAHSDADVSTTIEAFRQTLLML